MASLSLLPQSLKAGFFSAGCLGAKLLARCGASWEQDSIFRFLYRGGAPEGQDTGQNQETAGSQNPGWLSTWLQSLPPLLSPGNNLWKLVFQISPLPHWPGAPWVTKCVCKRNKTHSGANWERAVKPKSSEKNPGSSKSARSVSCHCSSCEDAYS